MITTLVPPSVILDMGTPVFPSLFLGLNSHILQSLVRACIVLSTGVHAVIQLYQPLQLFQRRSSPDHVDFRPTPGGNGFSLRLFLGLRGYSCYASSPLHFTYSSCHSSPYLWQASYRADFTVLAPSTWQHRQQYQCWSTVHYYALQPLPFLSAATFSMRLH